MKNGGRPGWKKHPREHALAARGIPSKNDLPPLGSEERAAWHKASVEATEAKWAQAEHIEQFRQDVRATLEDAGLHMVGLGAGQNYGFDVRGLGVDEIVDNDVFITVSAHIRNPPDAPDINDAAIVLEDAGYLVEQAGHLTVHVRLPGELSANGSEWYKEPWHGETRHKRWNR